MKNKTLLLLASLVVLTTVARAAQNSSDTNPVVLPTYVVEAPRYLPAEVRINASLNELRRQTRVPVVIAPDLSALKAQVSRGDVRTLTAHNARPVHVAKS